MLKGINRMLRICWLLSCLLLNVRVRFSIISGDSLCISGQIRFRLLILQVLINSIWQSSCRMVVLSSQGQILVGGRLMKGNSRMVQSMLIMFMQVIISKWLLLNLIRVFQVVWRMVVYSIRLVVSMMGFIGIDQDSLFWWRF